MLGVGTQRSEILTPCRKAEARRVQHLNVKNATFNTFIKNRAKYPLDLGGGARFPKMTRR